MNISEEMESEGQLVRRGNGIMLGLLLCRMGIGTKLQAAFSNAVYFDRFYQLNYNQKQH